LNFSAVDGPATLDHIAVAAATLEEGVAWVTSKLGVAPGPGGAHPDMGTHNRLLRLDDIYLEVIAPDPAVPHAPITPRWFGLDDPGILKTLRDQGPYLIGYVARTHDIHGAVQAALSSPGVPRKIRRGALEWLFTVAADGSLLEGGALPPLIQWPDAMVTPATNMAVSGLTLINLEITHPAPNLIARALAAINFQSAVVSVVAGQRVRLRAELLRPTGDIAIIG
jgi:hypothetical protein